MTLVDLVEKFQSGLGEGGLNVQKMLVFHFLIEVFNYSLGYASIYFWFWFH